MAALSKLHKKCEKFKQKDSCNNKRMVACALAPAPQVTINEVTIYTSSYNIDGIVKKISEKLRLCVMKND